MKTLSFIGSDKNAGKTTVFNFVYSRLCNVHGSNKICVTSAGIGGVGIDSYEGHQKPVIPVKNGSFFVTSSEHLIRMTGRYSILHVFHPPEFSMNYVFGRSECDMKIILEGPNNRGALLKMKEELNRNFPELYLLIDGSVDRQFLAHPDISDGFYFSLLSSKRAVQQRKAEDLLFPISLPTCPVEIRAYLERNIQKDTKSILLSREGKVLYHSTIIPFLDDALREACLKYRNRRSTLYLNGALSKSLFTFLASFGNSAVILDNFTLYQNVSVEQSLNRRFKPELFILNPVKVEGIFIRQESPVISLKIPATVPVYNLFREGPDEIGI